METGLGLPASHWQSISGAQMSLRMGHNNALGSPSGRQALPFRFLSSVCLSVWFYFEIGNASYNFWTHRFDFNMDTDTVICLSGNG